MKLPPQSPNLNAYAERFVRSIKESCLDRIILFGEKSLRSAARDFVAHYHMERNHQGLQNRLIHPRLSDFEGSGPITRRTRIGGLLNYYHRAAARVRPSRVFGPYGILIAALFLISGLGKIPSQR